MTFSEILDYLREINTISVVLRLALATLFGGIIGMERGKKKRPAGFRTHMLVCIGSALAMMTNQYICAVYNFGDPSRLGAQVISGIGFLGAGTIIVTGRQQVKGLTTAAGLWASACMGLAIGVGFYEGAILGGLSIFLVITVLHRLDNYLYSRSPVVDIILEAENMSKLSGIFAYLKSKGVKVSSFETTNAHYTSQESTTAMLTLTGVKTTIRADILLGIGEIDGILYVEEIV